jgi:hypothetical protein
LDGNAAKKPPIGNWLSPPDLVQSSGSVKLDGIQMKSKIWQLTYDKGGWKH